MTLSVTHQFVSPLADDADPNTVSPTNWNATHSLSGTLALANLDPSVVGSVVNDTNVTGSIAAQALTLGWTGTLAAARLNANVVQGITNDTNVTGTISAQNLTLGWTGQLAGTRGGTGVNNGSSTITIGASLTTTGAGAPTLAFPGSSFTYTFQGSSDTILGRATADTLTNKTYDTAGAGNVFKINGNGVSAVTGTGSTAVLSASPTLSGVLKLANGAVNAPALTLGDSTTGAYRPALNTWAITTNSTLGLYVDASQRVGINTLPASSAQLDVNMNASGNANASAAAGVRLTAADTTAAGFVVSVFGSQGVNVFTRADNTQASPAAVASGSTIGALSFQPYSGSAYTTLAQVRAQTAELQSGTAGGTNLDILTTPKTTRSLTLMNRFHGSGGQALGSGSATTDPGNGCLLLSPQTFASLSAAGTHGRIAAVSDSTTVVWGATITGGGANKVLAFDDGANWTVMGK